MSVRPDPQPVDNAGRLEVAIDGVGLAALITWLHTEAEREVRVVNGGLHLFHPAM
ncbi:hypothetical protein [Streptacidiphilus sp. MAP5-3]|uniref:hypothetical protein n=1 Tax=unclassified Streptacidiphilus TaxID=2643834 RepID=UPI0035118F54